MVPLKDLRESEKQILGDLTQKGANAASAAISSLVKKKVTLKVRDINYSPIEKVSKTIFDVDTVVTTLYLKVTGDVAGSIVLIFPNECAFFLVDLLSEQKEKKETKLDEYEKSILKEISNIVSGSFLKSLSDYLSLSFIESIPDMVIDMAQAALDTVLVDFAHSAQKAITIDVVIESQEEKIKGHFFLLFDGASAETILEALRKK